VALVDWEEKEESALAIDLTMADPLGKIDRVATLALLLKALRWDSLDRASAALIRQMETASPEELPALLNEFERVNKDMAGLK